MSPNSSYVVSMLQGVPEFYENVLANSFTIGCIYCVSGSGFTNVSSNLVYITARSCDKI